MHVQRKKAKNKKSRALNTPAGFKTISNHGSLQFVDNRFGSNMYKNQQMMLNKYSQLGYMAQAQEMADHHSSAGDQSPVQFKIVGNEDWLTFKGWSNTKGFGLWSNNKEKDFWQIIKDKNEIYEKQSAANAIRFGMNKGLNNTVTTSLDEILSVVGKEGAKGHAWTRHGSDVSDQELKKRLTTDKDRNQETAPTGGQPSSRFRSVSLFKTTLTEAEKKLNGAISDAIKTVKPKVNDHYNKMKTYKSYFYGKKTDLDYGVEEPKKRKAMEDAEKNAKTAITSVDSNKIPLNKVSNGVNAKFWNGYSVILPSTVNLARAYKNSASPTLDNDDYKFTFTQLINLKTNKTISGLKTASDVDSDRKLVTHFPQKAGGAKDISKATT